MDATAARKISAPKCADFCVAAFFMAAMASAACRLLAGAASYDQADGLAQESDVLILAQCALGLAALFLPGLINRLLRVEIPPSLRMLFSAFLFCSIYLGEALNFYSLVPHWDVALHCASGAMAASLGFTLFEAASGRSGGNLRLTPAFCAAFAFLFALGIGVAWELYEFSLDGLLGLNMQKTMLSNGEFLAGHAAVADTMKDIGMDCLGALASSAFCRWRKS
jgi:hypothetical protein